MEPRPDPNTSSNNCLNDQLLEAADKPARAADAADVMVSPPADADRRGLLLSFLALLLSVPALIGA